MSGKNTTPAQLVKSRRRKRFSTYKLPREPNRARTWIDLIEMADVLLKEGIIPFEGNPERDRHCVASHNTDEVVTSFSTLVSISVTGAKKCLKLIPLRKVDRLWKFLKESYMFPLFADITLTTSYTAIRNSGGALSLDLIDALLTASETPVLDQRSANVARPKSKPRKLDKILDMFNDRAKEEFLTMYFKIACVISTLCTYFHGNGETRKMDVAVSKASLVDTLLRYAQQNWKSSAHQRMLAESCCDRLNMVEGWHLVTEVFKVQIQEMTYRSEVSRTSLNRPSTEAGNARLTTKFSAWLFNLQNNDSNPESFAETLVPVFRRISDLLMIEISSQKQESLSEETIFSALDAVARGGPTLPQIRYDAARMIPRKRGRRINESTVWNAMDVLLRCRPDDTLALQKYESFLRKDEIEDETVPETPCDECPVPDESVPPTPAPEEEIQRVTESKKRCLNSSPSSKQDLAKRLKLSHHLERLARGSKPEAEETTCEATVQAQVDFERVPEYEENYLEGGDNSNVEERETDSSRPPLPVQADDQRQNVSLQPDAQQMKFANDLNLSIQRFYAEVLGWPVVPCNPGENPLTSEPNVLFDNSEWLHKFLSTCQRYILKDATTAFSLQRYRDHWKTLLPIEVRGSVSEAVCRMFPNKMKNPCEPWTKDVSQTDFLRVTVRNVAQTRYVINMTCTCSDFQLSKRMVEEMRGGSLCVGYLESGSLFSGLSIIACRSISYDRDEVYYWGDEKRINLVEMKLALSRHRFKQWPSLIGEGTVVRLKYLVHFSTYLRMFKTLEELFRIPKTLQLRLFGRTNVVELPFPNMAAMEKAVDVGSLAYLKSVKVTEKDLDDSQYEALIKVFSSVGSCEESSSSMSLIQGPPGTGKTKTILSAIGAILHHSRAGHVGKEQVNHLKGLIPDDYLMRKSTNKKGAQILVVCPSNQAVDNVLRRVRDNGTPDGRGGKISPQCVRVASEDHDYKDLKEYSVDSKALPFDLHLFHQTEPNRRTASNPAKRSLGKETVIVFTTLGSCAGTKLKQLRNDFDFVSMDEAAQSFEPEALMAIVTSCKPSLMSRCHIVKVGDHRQLRRVSNALHMVNSANIPLRFRYARQIISMFERLFDNSRCVSSMLKRNYRTHPSITAVHSEAFYSSQVVSALPESHFSAPYNAGCRVGKLGFAPFTIIDTSKLSEKAECAEAPGKFINTLEVQIISEILDELKEICEGDVTSLKDEIVVMAPYRSAVDDMRTVLRSPGYALSTGLLRHSVEVDTVDSMQGGEKDVVIFSAVRSNPSTEIGFLANQNRLNVALSRARKLLIIVGDMATLAEANTEIFKKFQEHCFSSNKDLQIIERVEKEHGRSIGVSKLIAKPTPVDDSTV